MYVLAIGLFYQGVASISFSQINTFAVKVLKLSAFQAKKVLSLGQRSEKIRVGIRLKKSSCLFFLKKIFKQLRVECILLGPTPKHIFLVFLTCLQLAKQNQVGIVCIRKSVTES